MITLHDVAIQLGLICTGKLITGTTYTDWRALCRNLLGVVLPDNKLDDGRQILN